MGWHVQLVYLNGLGSGRDSRYEKNLFNLFVKSVNVNLLKCLWFILLPFYLIIKNIKIKNKCKNMNYDELVGVLNSNCLMWYVNLIGNVV